MVFLFNLVPNEVKFKIFWEGQKNLNQSSTFLWPQNIRTLKFICSEKASKFCEIFPLLLTLCTEVKSKKDISQIFAAFSEYMNFTKFLNISPFARNNVIKKEVSENNNRHEKIAVFCIVVQIAQKLKLLVSSLGYCWKKQ